MMNLEPCVPPFWARTAHAQTIFGYLLPSECLKSKGRRFELPLADGDSLVGFILEGTSKTVVSIFHGLAGSVDSSYIHRTAILAAREGHTVIVVNHRGCGEGLGFAKGPYHSGRAEDLSAVIAMARGQYPHHKHLAVGFSLSANALLLLMSGRRGDVQPDAAIAVNAPINLEKAAHLLKRGLNRIYDIKFYRQCRRDLIGGKKNQDYVSRLPCLTTLHEFDNLYTAPAGGFSDREDYYQSCSTYQALAEIERPTFIMTANDDPFVPSEDYRKAHHSSSVHLHIEEYGGHMGYLSSSKTPLGTKRWQDYAVLSAMRKLI